MSVHTLYKHLITKLLVIKQYYFTVIRMLDSIIESITEHPIYAFLQELQFPKRYASRKNPIINYLYKVISTSLEASILILFTGGLSFLIYYTLGMLWYLYLGTPMADDFISLHPERAETIIHLASLDLVYFCTEVTLSAFVICFAMSAICQFTHISHYLYLSQGLFGKLVYWGIPLTGAVSYYIKIEYGFSDLNVICCIAMIPTYLMFISCFKYSQKLIPEAGEVLAIAIPWIKRSYLTIDIKIKYLIRYFMNN